MNSYRYSRVIKDGDDIIFIKGKAGAWKRDLAIYVIAGILYLGMIIFVKAGG